MKLDVLNQQGQATGRQIDLPEAFFGVEPNDHVIYLAVKQFLANQRQGTHKAKERGEIKGSTKKIKRQKGTGTARAGSLKNPLFRGGGRVFGPKPRDYSFKVNKKTKSVARNSALSIKARDERIIIIEDFDYDTPKTKDFISLLRTLELEGKKVVLVTGEEKRNLYLSARNVPQSSVVLASGLNTYNILNNHTLILSESVVAGLK